MATKKKKTKGPIQIPGEEEESWPSYKKPMAVELSDDEVDERKTEAGELNDQLKALKEKKKKITEEVNQEIKAAQDGIQRCLDAFSSGTEDREVEVCDVPDYKHSAVRTYRLDVDPPVMSGERPMRKEERQLEDERLTGGKGKN